MTKQLFLRTLMTLLFLSLIITHIFPQSNFKNDGEVRVPSTDAWNMIKYGDVNKNLYNGTISLSIPFYTYKDNDFELPIYLSYSSSGHMPNSKAGILGPDWQLIAGGVITTEIKGIPDYQTRGTPGYFLLSKQNKSILNSAFYSRASNQFSDPDFISGFFPASILFVPNSYQPPVPSYDGEPDIYHFNFAGYSGSFQRRIGNETYVYNSNINNQEFKVVFADDFSSITMIASNGYKYYFSTSISYSDMCFNEESQELNKKIAWKLSKILAPNGRTVVFDYISKIETTIMPASCETIGTITLNSEYLIVPGESSKDPLTSRSSSSNFEYTLVVSIR